MLDVLVCVCNEVSALISAGFDFSNCGAEDQLEA